MGSYTAPPVCGRLCDAAVIGLPVVRAGTPGNGMGLAFSTWRVALKDWYMGMALDCKPWFHRRMKARRPSTFHGVFAPLLPHILIPVLVQVRVVDRLETYRHP